jgi:hypothetical protein
MCSHVADTPAAASFRKMVSRLDLKGTTDQQGFGWLPEDRLIKTAAEGVLATS